MIADFLILILTAVVMAAICLGYAAWVMWATDPNRQ